MELKPGAQHQVDTAQICLGWTGREKGSATLEKVFSFRARCWKTGKRNLSWEGMAGGRLKWRILSPYPSDKAVSLKEKKQDLGLNISRFFC